ncbi:unnamed protein product [Calypogeia fissa]
MKSGLLARSGSGSRRRTRRTRTGGALRGGGVIDQRRNWRIELERSPGRKSRSNGFRNLINKRLHACVA